MTTIDVHETGMELALLVERVERGETILIAKAGKPIAKLVPMDEPGRKAQRLGGLEGQFRVPDDFDRMMDDEIAAMFAGER